MTVLVNRACHQLLAGSRFSQNQRQLQRLQQILKGTQFDRLNGQIRRAG